MRDRRGFERHHTQLLRHGAGVQDDAGKTSWGDAPVQHETRQERVVSVVVRIRLTSVGGVAREEKRREEKRKDEEEAREQRAEMRRDGGGE